MDLKIEENVVLYNGAPIATIAGNTCTSEKNLAPVLKGAIRRASGNAELAFVLLGVNEDPEEAPQVPVGQVQEAAPLPPSPAVVVSTLSPIAVLLAKAQRGLIPQPPKQHPHMGDKDPAFVAWAKEHMTHDDFAKVYEHRKLPTHQEYLEGEKKRFGKLRNETEDN